MFSISSHISNTTASRDDSDPPSFNISTRRLSLPWPYSPQDDNLFYLENSNLSSNAQICPFNQHKTRPLDTAAPKLNLRVVARHEFATCARAGLAQLAPELASHHAVDFPGLSDVYVGRLPPCVPERNALTGNSLCSKSISLPLRPALHQEPVRICHPSTSLLSCQKADLLPKTVS